jgi:hypothetical protein
MCVRIYDCRNRLLYMFGGGGSDNLCPIIIHLFFMCTRVLLFDAVFHFVFVDFIIIIIIIIIIIHRFW